MPSVTRRGNRRVNRSVNHWVYSGLDQPYRHKPSQRMATSQCLVQSPIGSHYCMGSVIRYHQRITLPIHHLLARLRLLHMPLTTTLSHSTHHHLLRHHSPLSPFHPMKTARLQHLQIKNPWKPPHRFTLLLLHVLPPPLLYHYIPRQNYISPFHHRHTPVLKCHERMRFCCRRGQ